MADGKITFSTELDNKELEKQLQEMNEEIKSHEKELKNLEKERTAAAKTQEAALKRLTKARQEYEASRQKVSDLQKSQEPEISSFESVQSQIQKAKQEAEDAKNQWVNAKGGTNADQNLTAAQEKIAQLQVEYDNLLAKIQGYDDKIAAANVQLEQQKAEVNSASAAFEAAKQSTAGLEANIASVQSQLSGAEAAAGGLVQQLQAAPPAAAETGQKVSALEKISQKVESGFDKLGKRIGQLALNAFVFNLISKGLSAVVSKVKDAIAADDEASAAFARLKGAVLTAIQPILNFVVPVLTTLANVLTRVITLVMNLFGASFLANNKKSAKALNDKKKAVTGVGEAAKKASKYLAGFDELNVMNSDDSSDYGGYSGGADSSGIEPDFDFDTGFITDKLDEIIIYISGALLAVGAILAFSGINIPLGIGLMAVGALTLAAVVKENWDAMPDNVRNALTAVLATIGAAALVIGLILALSGVDIPLGIGLIAIGAVALAGTVALNWNTISELLQGEIGRVTTVVSGALLVIGSLLCFSGVGIPLGIGLILVGAAGLATTAAANWNAISELLQGELGGVVAIVSGFLLVLGILLCVSGVGIPLGIGLILAGAAGLATVVAVNWNFIVDKVKEIWNAVKNFWNSKIAPVFTIAFWQEKFTSIADGLKSAIHRGINAAIGLLNTFIDWVNAKMHFQWGGLNIGGIQLISPGEMQLFTIPHIPYLAQGAVIPPNREFLAVLGDQSSGNNVEAPESLIRKIVREETRGMSSRRVEELLETLISVVNGIEVGDETIGRAAARYNRVAERARGY